MNPTSNFPDSIQEKINQLNENFEKRLQKSKTDFDNNLITSNAKIDESLSRLSNILDNNKSTLPALRPLPEFWRKFNVFPKLFEMCSRIKNFTINLFKRKI